MLPAMETPVPLRRCSTHPTCAAGLPERGIDIPDDTWFIAGLHETVSDQVELLDTEHAPMSHQAGIAALRERLAVAAAAQVVDRSAALPGPGAAGTGTAAPTGRRYGPSGASPAMPRSSSAPAP